MPLTSKGEEIMSNMKSEYGSPEKAKEVFYASENKGTISGVDSMLGGGCDTVQVASCYDQSYPPMDPTSIGAMPTMEKGADEDKTDAFEPTAAGCDPAMSFDEAVFGPAAHDYGADKFSSMGGLPETVTHRQMQNFGASFNFGEGVTK